MAEETSRDNTTGLADLTLHGVSEIEASLTDEGIVPEDFVFGFNSEDPQIRKASVIKIRKILGGPPPSNCIQPVIDTGLVPAIVSLLDSEDTSLQYEAAWIVTNIAAGTTQQTEHVIDAGAIPRLIILSASPNADVADLAVWALKKHVLPSLARYIQETPVNEANMESIEAAVQALDRMCKHHLQGADFIATGVVPRLVKLLADSSSSIALQRGVLKCLGYLVTGSDADTDVAVDAGLLPGLLLALEIKDGDLCRLALWNASNVAAKGHSQVCALLDSGLLKPVVRVLMDDQESTISRRHACWTISNLADEVSGDAKVAQAFIEGRCVEALSAALLIPDLKAKERAVIGITRLSEWKPPQGSGADKSPLTIFRSASGPQNLRAVRNSRDVDDEDIKTECQGLLTLYFPDCSRRARV
ncbi:glycoside hydrolase family 30 protein [Tulasnella calospora MUT 4182]|uniref:Glycoside hydrolase family 30 protein n=1 Tax=Tulasnella calospora MUT 4182 TaxID=1051891 RepID=A0A0C3L640_9AGAM|nr:glycoside hydrolase family 30 protein [Tulasnella calospora MUT 4182]